MCPALGVTRQGHYAWRRRGPSARDLRDAEPVRPISEVYESSRGIYGAPKVHMELRRRGFRTSCKRVARIMRDNGRSGATRGFTADGPDKAWFADIACARTRRGWPCLALVMDIWLLAPV